MKSAEFKSTIASIEEIPSEDFKHPLLTLAKFIFLDDRGNDNKQGVKVEDFEDIVKTAIDTPVKMLYTNKGVKGHFGSIPIGHIKTIEKSKAEDGANLLVATAMLYSEEYPEEISYLKEAYASGSAPGVSYELLYKDSIVENGIEWLKKITTKAATFVRIPAYGSRTALLALAANAELSTEDFVDTVVELVHQWEDKTSDEDEEEEEEDDTNESTEAQSIDKGGNDDMELEEKVAQLEADAATKQSEIERLMNLVSDKETEINTLTAQINDYKKNALVTERERRFVEAGLSLESDAEKLAKKREFWASLSDEAFDEYLTDLVSARATAPATPAIASRKETMPKLAVARTNPMDIEELKASIRSRD